jgi:hypothetical protein
MKRDKNADEDDGEEEIELDEQDVLDIAEITFEKISNVLLK